MRDECEMLLLVYLHFQCPLGRIGLLSQANRFIEYAVDDVERFAFQINAMALSQVVETTAQDIVLGDNLLEVEFVSQPL